ncbi:alpha/beta fold hydrolase [Arthrobacter sp. CAN_C5]|uniref:alpha/beta fold hydrolase n=1 Tax=Arthrobacter sp. CAN_C5 TaxID=2760706 RepID=UPI001AEA7B9F|nr:alpha/beta hydrolase [Arthrobacter sp. CAN_C5]MBP2217618.1 pimeloyl-ACP methyl ester carboxylesterase [Arthrobacter sp. CAN_C5]
METRSTMINGRRARWAEHGTGSPVVLVHGIPTSPRLWRHVMPLVDGKTLAWEMPGYGSSIPDGKDLDIGLSAQAEYLVEWIESLDLDEPPVLVGHDLGGGVAQIATVRAAERFAGLVLTNSVSYDSWPIPSVKAMQRVAPVLAVLPQLLMYPTFVQLIHRGHDDRNIALESLAEHWGPYVAQGAARSMMRQVSALNVQDTLDIADRLAALNLPARVVWGEADAFQKIKYGERLAADLGADLIRIPGGKHFTPEDHPQAIAAAINSLLTESRKD